jgi:[ribosomal protein S18]-alanine N-acetyltransferase
MIVHIRAGDKADVDAVMAVMTAAFDPQFGEAWSADQCLAILCLPGTRLVVAESKDCVGFAIWRTVLDESELFLIAVAPNARNSGTGRALLQHAVTESKRSGAQKLFVEVRVDNPAVAFYQRQGFEQSGMRNNYYKRADGGPTDALTLHLML